MIRPTRTRIAQLLLAGTFAYFGLAQPQQAEAGQAYSPAGEGASANVSIAQPNGSGGAGLIGVDETTGAATASLRFEIPPARGVSTPSLGLTYTAGIDGVAGYGWELPIPAFERAPLSNEPKYDGPGAINQYSDRITFAGEVLVPICEVGVACPSEPFASWASGWHYYRAQNDRSRARYFWSPGGERWRVEYPSGECEDYGVLYGDLSAVDRDIRYDNNQVLGIFRWNLVRRYQAAQPRNYVAYRWANDTTGPEYLRGHLTDIYHTPTLDAPLDVSPFRATFAHHVHFEYDRTKYPGFHEAWQGPGQRRHAPPRTYRLSHVDVSSAPPDQVGPRSQVRRYWLNYEDHGPRRSLLVSMDTEGAKGASGNTATENSTGLLPPSPTLLMATSGMTLEYSAREYATSPVILTLPNATDKLPVIIKDINEDGLPDAFQPAKAVLQSGPVGGNTVYLGKLDTIAHGVTFQNATVRNLLEAYQNPTLSDCPVDAAAFFADGSQTFVGEFSGRNETLGIFRGSLMNCVFAARGQQGGIFLRRDPQQTVDQGPNVFDIQNQAGDVDGDGLLDLIGRDPNKPYNKFNGDIMRAARREGQVRMTGVNVFAQRLLITSRFADVDGDGCADRYYTENSQLGWQPSECNGYFYPNANSSWIDVTLPYNSQQVDLADVDGDGLADVIVLLAGQAKVVVLLNDGDGRSFGGAGREFTYPFPKKFFGGESLAKLTFADMNGSGTTDVVALGMWASQIGYVDLLGATPGATRAYQLKSITSGLGAKTTVTYARSVDLDAEFGWATHSPQPFDVVRTVETNAGSGVTSDAYFYQNPVYDAWNQRLRGFRQVRVRTAATWDAAAIQHTHRVTYYAIGSCGSMSDECPLDRDPEADTLTTLDLPYRVDVFSDDEHLSSLGPQLPANPIPRSQTLTSYHLSTVRGLDLRTSTQTQVEQVDTVVYDKSGTSQTVSGTILHGTIGVGGIVVGSIEGLTPVTIGDPTSTISMNGDHIRQRFEYDAFGNPSAVHDDGRVGIDRTIDSLTDWDIAPTSDWTWRPARVRTPRYTPAPGDRPTFDRETDYTYDAGGHVTKVSTFLDGTVSLDRHHSNPNKATAPQPPGGAANGLMVLAQFTYDVFGNVESATGATGGCESWVYDKAFLALPIEHTVGGCNGTGLTTTTLWDRGLNAPVRIDRPDNRASTFGYDAFGRIEDVYAPDPQLPGFTVFAGHFHYFDPTLSGEMILPARVHGTGPGFDTWTYLDGVGREMHSLRRADPSQGDGGDWIVQGYYSHFSDRELRLFDPWFYSGDPLLFIGQGSETVAYTRTWSDPYGRPVRAYERDGTIVGNADYHGLVADTMDESGNFRTTLRDGHGRVLEVDSTLNQTKKVTTYTYLSTGETTEIREYPLSNPSDVVYRWMAYDSLGRLVENGEPNSTKNFGPPTNVKQTPWRYAYDAAGRVVGTSDARGCGKNVFYDSLGRALAEDWSPCDDSQPDYSPPNLTTGDGTEQFAVFDTPEPGQNAPVGTVAYRGHLAATYDRGAHTQLNLDGRSRVVGSSRWIAKPGAPADTLAARYAPHAYHKDAFFDLADRVRISTTGADVADLLVNGQSATDYTYTARGTLGSIGSSYGALAGAMTYYADGLQQSTVFHDRALTTATMHYDPRRRIDRFQLLRPPSNTWTDPVSNGETIPTTLEDEVYHYDFSGNLSAIEDFRLGYEWPAGSKPVNRVYQHDDQQRLTRVDYTYPSGVDSQVSPFAAEEAASSSAPVPRALISTRATYQSYSYDPHGRPSAADDDQHATWDRSLDAPVYADATKPHTLTSAGNGKVQATYDVAGNTTRVDVARLVSCSAPSGTSEKCAQVFAYEWDEVGQLSRARRWDVVTIPSAALPAEAPIAELRYGYSGGARVVRENLSSPTAPVYFVDVFGSLRLENTTWDGTDYVRSQTTESVYLSGFARLVSNSSLPNTTSDPRHVVFTLGDLLGSTTTVIDGTTGELIERATYQAYGTADSDLRPTRWGAFRENFRFTGKEDDVEVGLLYFGARYYAPNLGRWLSPDPLMVHGVGPELDVYSYVDGHPDSAVDPNGLCEGNIGAEQCPPGNDNRENQNNPPVWQIGPNDASSSGTKFGPGSAAMPATNKNISVTFPGCAIARGLNILGITPSNPAGQNAAVDVSGVFISLAYATVMTALAVAIVASGAVVLMEVAALPAYIPALWSSGNYGLAALATTSAMPGTTAIITGAVAAANDPLSIGGIEGEIGETLAWGAGNGDKVLFRVITESEPEANFVSNAAMGKPARGAERDPFIHNGVSMFDTLDRAASRIPIIMRGDKTVFGIAEVRIPAGAAGITVTRTLSAGHYTVTGAPTSMLNYWWFSWISR